MIIAAGGSSGAASAGAGTGSVFDSLLGDEIGVTMVLVGFAAMAASIGFSVIVLRLLHDAAPRVGLPAPRWGAAEVFLAFAFWFVSLNVCALAAGLALATVQATIGFPIFFVADVGGVAIAGPVQHLGSALGGLLFAGGVLLVPRIVDRPIQVLGIGTGSLGIGTFHAVLIGLAIVPGMIAIGILWQMILSGLGLEPEPQSVVADFIAAVTDGEWLRVGAIAVMAVIVAPITEELLFRVVLFRWLAQRWGTRPAIVTSGVIFGIFHFSIAGLLPLALLGMLFAAILRRTGNLWTCIALHALFNGSNLALITIVGLASS